jgi:hypothetical protein
MPVKDWRYNGPVVPVPDRQIEPRARPAGVPKQEKTMGNTSIKKFFALLILIALLAIPTPSGAAEVTIGTGGEILVDGAPFYPIMTWLQSSSRIM